MDASSPAAPTDQSYRESLIRKTLATVGLVALLAVPAFFLVVLQRSTNLRMLRAGDSIPTAGLNGVDPGGALLAGISEKRAAILFFSVDCPHCQNEIPIFNEAERRFGSDVGFVAIALNDKQKAESFVRTHDVRTKVHVDEKGIVGKLFGVSEVPAIFLVNENQRIEWVGVGEQPRTELFRRLSALVAKGPLTAAENTEKIRK
ncbi:MAG: TlpA disulfide reductase family protein [Ignavibacteriales bacterium]|nr:TlpA disulfide reductase family protein [Ignavibacteriales bacterium]